MPRPPAVSGRETIGALEKGGSVRDRQEGSHITLRHHARRRRATVSVHGNEDLPPGTLRAILRQAGLSVEEFTQLLK